MNVSYDLMGTGADLAAQALNISNGPFQWENCPSLITEEPIFETNGSLSMYSFSAFSASYFRQRASGDFHACDQV